MKRGLTLLASLVLLAALTACGGGNNSGNDNGAAASDVEATQSIEIIASNWEFDQQEYKAKAGEPLSVSVKNNGGYHGIAIDGVGEVKAGKDQVYTLEAGEYEIYCNIMCGNGHSEMKAKLIVE